MRVARRILIAIGSLAAAYLSVSLVGGMLTQVIADSPAAWTGARLGTLVTVVILVLGAVIYRDILRRDVPATGDRDA